MKWQGAKKEGEGETGRGEEMESGREGEWKRERGREGE